MCGIYGYKLNKAQEFRHNETVFNQLMKLSDDRGKEASGVACISENNDIAVLRSSLSAKDLLESKEYKQFEKYVQKSKLHTVIGHSRLATHGIQLEQINNQPVISDDSRLICIHNGIITNCSHLWSMIGLSEKMPVLDTKVLIEYYDFLRKELSIKSALYQLFRDIEGSVSMAIIDTATDTLILATNTGSLYYHFSVETKTIFFASERIFLEEALPDFVEIRHLKPGWANIISNGEIDLFKIDIKKLSEKPTNLKKDKPKIVDFSFHTTDKRVQNLYSVQNKISELEKHTIHLDRIQNIQRCTKCILPATTPFIYFDKEGICNFCHEHIPITYKGKDQLERIIEKYRKHNGEPDCLAAFSGGRDSSYGLHYLKKELGLNPMAYTYDWGMVTDIARRNQARMLGKLGIEHLLLSADITKKRTHIQKNIKAWMKDPHLGMVPLFMQGDKQCEFYADQIMKKYNLKLMFFFRGNEFEKEEFKNGHCGIKDADPGGVIHHLPFKDKLKILGFYGYRYLRNPAYFNASFWDTSLAYFSTYVQNHDYLYLWHYIPWEEELINKTLLDEYNWEPSKESRQMWRTDDGSSAFYNYIYYQVQGFTENDSFRSRQIREGKLSRSEALEIVQKENLPRYESLLWYFDHVGLKGSEVLNVVDNMRKLY